LSSIFTVGISRCFKTLVRLHCMNKKKVFVLSGVIFSGFCLFVLFSAMTVIPPETLTRNRLAWLESRIRQYVEQKGQIPTELTVLPTNPGKDNSVNDGWGHPIQMSISGNVVTLTSFGKEGGTTTSFVRIVHLNYPKTNGVNKVMLEQTEPKTQ